jgi:hypothetical protein
MLNSTANYQLVRTNSALFPCYQVNIIIIIISSSSSSSSSSINSIIIIITTPLFVYLNADLTAHRPYTQRNKRQNSAIKYHFNNIIIIMIKGKVVSALN